MKTGIVVILFHPDLGHINTLIRRFNTEDWQLILVDNSPNSSRDLIEGDVDYVHFPENIGIAQAQNIGLQALFKRNINYAFLLDQDSEFTPDIASTLLEQFEEIKSVEPVAAIGPSIYCRFSQCVDQGVLQKGRPHSSSLKEVKQIIASGMLLSKAAFHKVGEKEGSLFIDGVDHEWCWRARSRGMKVFQSTIACMPHKQGDSRVTILGVTFKQGSPVRLYYQFRNVLTLAKRGYVPTYWKCRHVLAIPLRYIVNRYCFEQGEMRGYYMRKGLVDAVRKRFGPMTRQNK